MFLNYYSFAGLVLFVFWFMGSQRLPTISNQFSRDKALFTEITWLWQFDMRSKPLVQNKWFAKVSKLYKVVLQKCQLLRFAQSGPIRIPNALGLLPIDAHTEATIEGPNCPHCDAVSVKALWVWIALLQFKHLWIAALSKPLNKKHCRPDLEHEVFSGKLMPAQCPSGSHSADPSLSVRNWIDGSCLSGMSRGTA